MSISRKDFNMARFLEDYKPKKKKKQETTPKKAQSPSVSKPAENRAKQAQQQKMYGGNTKPQTVKRSTTTNNKTNTQQRQQTTSQQTQRTVDRLQQKYGGGSSYNRQATRRTQPKNSTISREGQRTVDRLTSKYGQNRVQRNQQEIEERRQASNQRRLEAQRQKSGFNSMASKETQEAANRAIRNTPGLVKKALKDTVSGHLQTIADITEITASNENGTKAKAMKMGIDLNDKKQMAELEQERKRTAEQAKLDREKWAAEQDQRQQEWDKKVNGAKGGERAYYGAVESGTGMLTDLAIGLGTQGGSLAAMFSRTYGTTRGQAQKEGATETEDRTYSFLQAAKEVGTELMFPGVGLAKGYAKKTGLPLAERVANNLTQRITNRTAADLTGAGVRLLGGTAEENLEEVAGFGLDPIIKEFSYGRAVRTRQKMADLQTESDQLRANIQSEDDARRVASYLSSSEWLDQNKQQYMDAGLNEKDAQEVAEKMRDYMTASLTGDTETMDVLEQDIARTLSKGEFSYTKSLDKTELLDTLASTTLLTMTTGLPGTATTAMRGSVIRDNLGTDGLRTLAESAMNYEDADASKRGEVARDRINSGKELTASQVYELAASQAQQVEKDTRRVVAKNNVVADTLESDRLVAPMIMRDEKGNIHGDPIITQRYNDSAQEAESALKDLDKEQKLSLSDSELAVGSRAIAGFQTGAFTINDANALNYTNTAVREAFEKVTGVDLGQYVVKTSSGAVDYAATNAATKDALFTMAADNFIETARAETENFKDIAKGMTAEQMAARVGSEGDVAISSALDTVDPADEDTYGLMASAAQNVYEYGRYTEDTWDDVSANLSEMYPGLSQEALQDVYDAAKRDKAVAENPYYNARITAGESTSNMDMSEAEQAEYGKFTNDTGEDIGKKERAVLESIASEFNINIRLLPSEFFEYKYVDRNGKKKTAYSNGSYDPKTGTMLLNGGNDMERNIIAVALHEITHHIAIYAPDEYLALSNRVMETWYKNDADAFSRAIQRKQDNYKAQIGQNLSEEQALEEVIADAMGEMSADPDFISQICTEEPSLTEQIINAIRSVMRKLRAILASGNVAEEHEDAFFNQLGIWDDAQRLWLEAAKVAQQQRANQMIDDWDAQARQNTPVEETIEEIAEDLEPKERFSVDEPIERVRDLIAVHNLKPQDLINTFDLGGFPMPSIAVTKDSMGHDMYGDITLMFHSDTIDPKKKRTNEVFGGDAYTPVFPRIHYKASSKVEKRLSDLYYEWSQKYGYDTVRPFYEYGQTLQDALDRAGGEAALIDQLKSDSNLMRMYLRINDNDVEDVMKITEITMPEGEVDLSKRLIDALGEEDIRSIIPEGITGREALQYRREWVEAHKEQLETVYRDYFTSSGVLSEEDIEAVIPEIKPGEYAVAVRKALDYLRHGATTTKEEKDYEATTNAIKQAAEETGYDEWIDDLFKGVEEKRGLRNDRDMFTASGNRRKWESLYEPVTLDGVVRVMSQELSAGANGLLGANPKGASQKSYRSLDEIRADEDRLQQLPEEEFKALEEAAVQKLSDVCADIVDSNSNAFQNRFGAALDVGEYIAEILNVTKDRATIKRKLQSDYNLKVSDTQMDALMEAIDEIANLPTGYFEAKPRRAVGFNEVKAAILPAAKDNDEYAAIRSGLEARGVPIYEYDADKEGDRSNVLNQAATENNLRFSLDDESRVMYTPKGIEVVQNPTDSEYSSMREEILAEYPWLRGTGEPLLRHTYDESGNEYYWNAFDGMHRDVEPYINRQYNTRTSQQWKWYEKPDKDDYPTDYSSMMNRYSINEDSSGKELTEGQREFFSNSKIVDDEGRLKVMYHGTQSKGFTIFDLKKAHPGTLGRGFYFTDSESHASNHGERYEVYLNIENPLQPNTHYISRSQLRNFIEVLAEDEDYGIENYGYGATVDSVLDDVWGKSDFQMLHDLNLTCVGDFAEAVKLFNEVNGTNYDGIVTEVETLAMYPEQIKLTVNENPSTDPDIRYSITPEMDEEYMEAVNSGNMEEAKRLVGEAAQRAGYKIHVYHGTLSEPFNRFMRPADNQYRYTTGSGFIYATPSEDYAENYAYRGEPFTEDYDEGFVMEGYMNISNLLDVGSVDDEMFSGTDFRNPDFNDEETINRLATNDLKGVAKAVNMTPYELIHYLGEEIYRDSEAVWDLVNRPKFTELIREQGHDGIKLFEWNADAYGVPEPTQIKLADAVTYAEDGSIIPLSERFNPENDDIRYSLPTEDSDGNILSDGQMEYFANSQARGAEGKLQVVYHTTNRGGFTVFDPSYSDDRRSLFFASNFDVSQTYGYNADKPISIYDMASITDVDSLRDYLVKNGSGYKGHSFVVVPNEEWQELLDLDADWSMIANHQSVYSYDNIVNNWKEYKATHESPTKTFAFDSYIKDVESGNINPEDYTILLKLPNKTNNKFFDDAIAVGNSIDELIRDIPKEMIDQYTGSATSQLQQHGYYKVYLNLENPMIVDANGANWNVIPYGSGEEASKDDAANTINGVTLFWEYDSEGTLTGVSFSIYGETKEADGEWEEYETGDYIENTLTDVDDLEELQSILMDDVYDMWSGTYGYDEDILTEIISNNSDANGDVEAFFNDRYLDVNGKEMNVGGTYTTRELAMMAQNEGHDGVIIRNLVDIGGVSGLVGDSLSDIFIAFSGEQVKDTRNTDPTNNPDIRYSIVDDEEAQSKMAYDDAMDTSYEALAYYETLIDEPEEQIELYAESLSEEKMNEFYAGLNSYTEHYVFDDPVLEEGRKRMARSRADFMERLNAEWNERWLTDGEILDLRSVRKDVREMVKSIMRNADTPNKVKNDIVNKTLIDIRLAYQIAKRGRIEIADALLWHTSMRMIEGVEFVNDDTFNEYKDLRDYLRTTRIQLGEEYWSDVDYQAFRKNNFGRIKLVKGETNVDEIYQEMCERWPEWFNEDEEMTPPDQLLQIEHVLDVIQPYKEAYSSEEAASIATDIAYDLSDIVYGKGKPYESIADKYKNRYDKQTQAMRQRHEEALRKVKEQRDKALKANRELKAVNRQNLKEQRTKYEAKTRSLKEKHREDLRFAREEAREKGQERERARWEAKETKRKERQIHKKYFDRIVKNYNWLAERLLTNTKDKHIPEQYKKELAELLGAFDLQTVRSKKLEIKNGLYYRTDYKSQKTIKMEAMKKAINNIEAKSEFFHLNDSITDIIDELLGREGDGSYNKLMSIEGKTIDELSVDELKKIDNLLKALKHEFTFYETVRTGAKRTQAADIGTAQVDSALEHANLFGPGKDYNNILGAADKILNMDEMTPAYLFKRIDPKNTGLGMMFRELRRSFDKYVKNQEQLNGWMEEILSPYHSGGKMWKKYGAEEIENWRRSKATNTFKLQNGDEIRLTPAQMMSVYCLAKRPQAYQHMVGAGIVVKPVTFQAKLETDLKRKTNWALPTILTDGDIKMISTALTPDQKKVADQLQQLMATKMAAWGNEASRAVIGIDLFEDPDYFPIQSDKAALEEDFTADQFVDMIRNFGFTKAVQPGARNAIAIDDIFTVVSTHCNNMNLYNAYSESMNDFMKVYNYHALREDGSDYSVKQAIAHAYSQKATTFISTFMRDLNGNVSKGRVTGIDNMMNAALGNAKKASVFANGRVALQQPTAIVRAFSVISPKYMKGIKIERGAMKEMFEHCPIALWKSWGYYDINMGKSIEDIMMNTGSWAEDKMTNIYGYADNVTWTAIWQMCKAEVKDKNPKVKEGSDEFWDLVNERMTEVVDLTQVVDSPFHRSHAMRDKQILVKMATSFMAEPTLTFNMVRDGLVNSFEMYKLGDKGEAAKLLSRTSSVFVASAFATAGAAAIWDVLRELGGGDDDDDKGFFATWWANLIENFQDNLKLWNNIYYIKDISSLFDGWGTSNLALQGWKQLADAYGQLTGSFRVSSKKAWWENALSGIGYLTGTPYGTILKDGKAIFKLFGLTTPAALQEQLDRLNSLGSSTKDMNRGDASSSGVGSSAGSGDGKSATSARLWTYDNAPFKIEDGSAVDKFLNHFGINMTAAEIAAADARAAQAEYQKKVDKITESLSEYSGEEYDKHLWDKQDLEGYGKALEEGNFDRADEIEKLFLDCGGSQDFLDGKKMYHYKKNYVKSIVYDPTDAQIEQQTRMKEFLLSHGMTETELSDKVYKSQTTKELKIAFRLNDEDAIVEELTPLIRAGLSYDDFVKAYKYRNRIDIKKYKDSDGKYAERLKSTGVYNWPINGQITSNFGHRSSPGGIGSTNHQGLDIAGNMGDPVGAADGGTVVYTGWYGGAGKTVMIEHDDGTVTQYSHLSWWDCKVGDSVAQGQTIGNVGSTGNSTGPHLHFGVKVNGSYVDPLTKLN